MNLMQCLSIRRTKSILQSHNFHFSADIRNAKKCVEESDRLHKQLKTEQLLKAQAVNKLAEIMNRKDLNVTSKGKAKVSSADFRRKDKECRKLQQELTQVDFVGIIVKSVNDQVLEL